MFRKFFSSLRVRLILIVFISGFPMLGLVFHLCGKIRANGISMARFDALALTRSIARYQDRELENAKQCLIDLADDPQITKQDSQDSTAIMSRFRNQTQGYASLAVAKPDGKVIASWPSASKAFSICRNFWYLRIATFHRPLVSGYHFCALSDRPVIIVARPFLDRSGTVEGILAAGLDLTHLNHHITGNHYPPGTTVTVVDRNGIILAHYPYSSKLIGTPMREPVKLSVLRKQGEGILDLRGVDGVSRIYGFTSIGLAANAEYVVVGIPRALAYAASRKSLLQSLSLLLAVMLLGSISAWCAGDLFVLCRVRSVLSVMGRLADGDLSARSGVSNADGELNQLAQACDQMADRLEMREMEARQFSEEKLRRSEARIQLIVEEMPIACIVWDTDCCVTLWNAAAAAVFGYSESEALGRQPQELVFQEETGIANSRRWQELLEGHNVPGSVNENRTRDGLLIICEWSSTPLEGPDGSVVAVVSMVQDITERKRSEAELRKLTKTLKVLSDCNQLLVRAQSEQELTEKICRLVVEVGGYRLAWVGYAEQDAPKTIRSIAQWGYDEGYVESLHISWSDSDEGRGPGGTAIRTGKPVVASEIQTDLPAMHRANASKRGYKSCIALPLLADGRAFGVLCIYSGESDVFDTEECRLLEELAADLAYGIGVLRTREEHRRAEDALRESEEQFRKLYEEAPVAYQSLDEQGRVCAVNRKWLEMFGYAEGEVIGRWFGDFLAPSFADGFTERFECLKVTGERHGIVSQMVCKSGQVLTVEVTGTTAFSERGQIKRYHDVLRDITDIQEAESAIQTLVESTVGITGSDYFDRIVEKVCAWFGAECAIVGEFGHGPRLRVLSRQVDGVIDHGSDKDLFRTPCSTVCEKGYCAVAENAREIFPDVEGFSLPGAEGYVGMVLKDSKGKPLGILAAVSRHKLTLPKRAEDIMRILAAKTAAEIERLKMTTEKNKMEQQLRQAQKMQAIGTLAGGIAHDFNNLLGIIYGYSEMSLLDVPAGSLVDSNIQNILKAADRARDLVQQILAFSRQSEHELKPLRLGPITEEVVKLLRAALPATVELQIKIQPEEDIILGDPTQVHQVLMNLCTNAGQAMLEKGGLLELTLGAVHWTFEDPARPLELDPGPYMQLTVRDTGPGMNEAVRERIFEPYFTTKQPGGATGLGLAVVHGIVTAYGGAIVVDSQVGIGTTFTVFFPRLEGGSSSERQEEQALFRGEGTILLVDDEPALLDSARQRLEYLGYRVVSCSNGTEALEIFLERPDEFQAVVTDQTMPHLTGMQLAEKILALRPAMPIILCTGYSELATPQQAQAMGIRELLMKPLNLRELAAALHRQIGKETIVPDQQ